MKRRFLNFFIWSIFMLMFTQGPSVNACTNFLISKGASVDGSVMITYVVDSHELYGELYFKPAAVHHDGSMIEIYDWDSGKYLGKIHQVKQTYRVVGNINQFQVAIGESTFGGRKELVNPKGIIDYGSLMYITLQRARSAREAIRIMGDLVARYGYSSQGESFSISDPKEAWIMEMIGKGAKNTGAVWVARRIPDGFISGHANQARIRHFPLNDPENCLYAKDIITFAREMGYFSGKDRDFSFVDAYAPLGFGEKRFCEARVWSMFNRAAPSLKLSIDYAKGEKRASPIPLWIKPDRKLSIHDVMRLMRDHFENTELDMSNDLGAGPFKLPYRWRPLTWKVDKTRYFNERAISTQQTGWSFITQSRDWLPNEIGGVQWFGVDDTYSTVYVPMYCGLNQVPKCFAVGTGDFDHFTWDSGFWVFNFVANYAYSRYCDMIQDIQKVQAQLEGKFISRQTEIEKAALELYKTAPQLAREYLTKYSIEVAESTVARWKKLGEYLIYKYLDGNKKDEKGKVTFPGYPKSWYKKVAQDTGDHLKVQENRKEK